MPKSDILWFEEIVRVDVAKVGGKNASLGEMVQKLTPAGVAVPPGFATTAEMFRRFVAANGIAAIIGDTLAQQVARKITLAEAGRTIRAAFLRGDWPDESAAAITKAYEELSRRSDVDDVDVAVRSSATAEDLPDASFAGQQETFLNVAGPAKVLDACRRCYASLFTDRAISYRQAKGFDHMKLALSVGVQRMVRSDLGSSGVMFSIDTETGFDRVVIINAAWGLGENVVQGAVDPDEYQVFKPFLDNPQLTPIIQKTLGAKQIKMIYAKGGERPVKNVPTSLIERQSLVLSDDDILALARWAKTIEGHYGCPMDIEWAKDGRDGSLFIVQARPETVQSQRTAGVHKSYRLGAHGRTLCTGLSIGQAIVSGPVCMIRTPDEIDRFVDGAILVTETTDPDWVPIMKRASAIVTDHGGRTSHAAIVSRELGLPAIVGTGDATQLLHDEQAITVSCAEGDQGFVYEGDADITVEESDPGEAPSTRTEIMLNLANPAAAARWWRLPADGVGLARMEFVINNAIKIHPMALVNFAAITDAAVRTEIEAITRGYADKPAFFVDRLAEGLARIAAVAHPHPCIVRMSDFKTNEYAHLVGGQGFEPEEANPMLGFRGASRYYSPRYREGFALECRAIRRLREEMGFANVIVMIPFCRTLGEADRVLDVMAENGLKRGQDGLQVYVMCEIPSNVILARGFAERFDGFSIGSNDLTQLTLGVDRDSSLLAELFDEEDAAVKWMIRSMIDAAREAGAKVGLCGQAPSDNPAFAAFLVECGIDSISISPDSFAAVKAHVARAEGSRPAV
ncbi:phosphoenolpyruvate synthase [Aurantimonas sp. C2-6-R+9]|uniref:phosphoenolpyruvate synthase n=1 Tax=unclassified Aurantimonas TaxID=2638230 RepID=UPI002E17E996|nr:MULTISPECIES: phosphoenolpyruvate synthase [unclassified Aurantimonas]MEC5292929.1 phosphoenolpyruvate synthase [Aurantimonas sp. C2-3-R2]MEC5383144.1 phosphoenolpyruvate synthase [Aurantimonas sp. C2-6-R+9]MEC5413963.1 phosphoenolpyruvate synthase [Aurantimonas sp. C2-4-R8]